MFAYSENGAAILTQYLLERTLAEIRLLVQTGDISRLTSLNKTTDSNGRNRRSAYDFQFDNWSTLWDTILDELKSWVQEVR